MNDQLSVLANIIVQTIAPDYSKLIAEIKNHEFMDTKIDPDSDETTSWHKILFVTSDTCVVQGCEMKFDQTRFETFGIPLSEWERFFGGWIDADHDRYDDCRECWTDGYEMYVAQPN